MSALRTRLAAFAGPVAAAVAGGAATDGDIPWFRGPAKPFWHPPWTGLHAGLGWAAGEVRSSAGDRERTGPSTAPTGWTSRSTPRGRRP